MIKIYTGDCRYILDNLQPESVHCCVTSPPYLGLRDYGLPQSIWGGNVDCNHKWGDRITTSARWGEQPNLSSRQSSNVGSLGTAKNMNRGQFCQACGAWLGSLGLEPTPELYIDHLTGIIRQIRRALRPDGTLWLNLGDSYAANRTYQVPDSKWGDVGNTHGTKVPQGLKEKDLIGIPWRTALTLQSEGWWLRSCIIWHKPNAMSESVKDRPTTAHEYVFLLSKSARYYYDYDEIREPRTSGPGLRNRRSVWSIPTRPLKVAHFATFPPDLIEPMILAGCPEGGTVLDPFGGSGTVGLVADRIGRDAVLIELNPEYAQIAIDRIGNDAPTFTEINVL